MAIKITHGADGITPACGICLLADRNMAADPRRAEIRMVARAAALGSRIECGVRWWRPRLAWPDGLVEVRGRGA
jgi:hypothetical protein